MCPVLLDKDKGSVIIRLLLRINSLSVGKIHQSLGCSIFLFLRSSSNMRKSRPEVCSEAALQAEMLRVFLHLGKLRNLYVILNLVITFNDVDFVFAKMVPLQQHGGRFIQKLLYQKALVGGRGVQHDDQLLHLRSLPGIHSPQ